MGSSVRWPERNENHDREKREPATSRIVTVVLSVRRIQQAPRCRRASNDTKWLQLIALSRFLSLKGSNFVQVGVVFVGVLFLLNREPPLSLVQF